MDTEALRNGYRPPAVRVLFVGGSPPAGGTFFYAANSSLYRATKMAFEAAVPDLLVATKFLDDFKALGCYLMTYAWTRSTTSRARRSCGAAARRSAFAAKPRRQSASAKQSHRPSSS